MLKAKLVLSAGMLTQRGFVSFRWFKSSALFREDQYSYILYPNKDLPRFEEE
jgi:hypothetical protein